MNYIIKQQQQLNNVVCITFLVISYIKQNKYV